MRKANLKKPRLRFDLLTLFPEVFEPFLKTSILGRAQRQKAIRVRVHNLRHFAGDHRGTVDDRPYGGGPGMVLKIEPIVKALRRIKKIKPSRTIILSASGAVFDQKKAQEFTKLRQIILLCGHYEGVDERVVDFVDEEISLGNFVLTGGEIPALALVDAVARLLPGVLGNPQSLKNESFKKNRLDYPQYTRPENFEGSAVPHILLKGHHAQIKAWREKMAFKKTAKTRPDLTIETGLPCPLPRAGSPVLDKPLNF